MLQYFNMLIKKGVVWVFMMVSLLCANLAIAADEHGRVRTTMIMDIDTKEVLYSHNANESVFPASLTKLMTLYVLFDHIKTNNLSLDHKFVASESVHKTNPSKLGILPGEKITVRDTILALIIKSANDVGVVCAENIAGSQEEFVTLMNKTAKRLGMSNTLFMNPHGWHHKSQKTTAMDMSKLALAIQNHHADFFKFFKITEFMYKNRKIVGHNRVTRDYDGAHGMKTGYTIPAGFNIVTSATRNGKNLLAVVTGMPSAKSRDDKVMKLLDQYFDSKTASVIDVDSDDNVFANVSTSQVQKVQKASSKVVRKGTTEARKVVQKIKPKKSSKKQVLMAKNTPKKPLNKSMKNRKKTKA